MPLSARHSVKTHLLVWCCCFAIRRRRCDTTVAFEYLRGNPFTHVYALNADECRKLKLFDGFFVIILELT